MTTFQDIFKSSFLERLDSVSLLDTAIALTLAFLLGLFIFLIYKRSQTAIHFLFLSFYGNTCSNQSRNRKEPTPCSIYLFFV